MAVKSITNPQEVEPMASLERMTVVLVHGAWADGSSWSEVIGPLTKMGLRVAAAPLSLSSLSDDAAAAVEAAESHSEARA